MSDIAIETPHGKVSGLLQRPADALALLILGHGAGADMHHRHMTSIAGALESRSIATLRFNFPFMEAGRNRTDRPEVCTSVINAVVDEAGACAGDLPAFLGGHSFGGRMASHFAADCAGSERANGAFEGLVYFSFPLHPANKPDTKRAAHLGAIRLPQLFLSGTRDALADLDLLADVVAGCKSARLHRLDTADHSFRTLKRTRTSEEDVYDEAAHIAAAFISDVPGEDDR